ncbi:hypothetical protein [Aurantimonas coralicida]|uniref:hypothetical protein n=1 Tax=Aurantimonas coralicida TaxID=182270 RepID=UPI001E2AE784|nr:hypothetical protein [Aurantimonas coralicida]MCD1644147.1 hypothetical protein [Aurantimonas coralicida]
MAMAAVGPDGLVKYRRMTCKECGHTGDAQMIANLGWMESTKEGLGFKLNGMVWPCPNCGRTHDETGALFQPSGDNNG